MGVINACLTGTTWGGCVIKLRISTQALVFSAAWIRVTLWSRTPHVKVDVNINSAIWTISESQANSCVSAPSPKRDCPPGYPRKAAIPILTMEATKHDWHHLHGTTITKRIPTQVSSGAQEMIGVIPEDRSTNAWMAASCKKEWETFRLPSVLSVSKTLGRRLRCRAYLWFISTSLVCCHTRSLSCIIYDNNTKGRRLRKSKIPFKDAMIGLK